MLILIMLFRASRVPLSGSRLPALICTGHNSSLPTGFCQTLGSPVMFYSSTARPVSSRGLISFPCDDLPRDMIRKMCQESGRRGSLIYRAFSRYDAAPPMHMRPAAGKEVCRRRDFCCGNSHQEPRGPGGSSSRAPPDHLRRPESLEWSICNKYVFSVLFPVALCKCQTHEDRMSG